MGFNMDIYNRKKRSEIMSKIRATNTKPEILVRRTLYALGYRFRLYGKNLPGKPDIVLPRHRAVIFVHGCFWHHHADCAKSRLPATNVKFWKAKILRNVQRDKKILSGLRRFGWRVMIVWECETKEGKFTKKLIRFLERNRLSIRKSFAAEAKYRLRDFTKRKSR